MLSERRWSDGPTAIRFFKSKANNNNNASSSPTSTTTSNGNGSVTSPPSLKDPSPKSYRRAVSAPVSVPVVTVISDDFCPSPTFSHVAHQNSPVSPSSEASSSTSTYSSGAVEGDDETTASLAAASTDDSVPDFPAGELSSGSSGTENFIKRFWRKRKSLTINEYDPSFKVVYLGNVLTGWAKGQLKKKKKKEEKNRKRDKMDRGKV